MQSIIGAKEYDFTEQRKFEGNFGVSVASHHIIKPSITKLLSYKNMWHVQEMSSNNVWLKKHIWATW